MPVDRIQVGGSDPAPDRPSYNLVAGSGITITAADDHTNNVSKATIAASPAAASITTAAIAGSAVTGAKLSSSFLKLYAFAGHNGAGACTLTGAAVGDRVVGVIDLAEGSISAAASFESAITVVNQIQQSSASDLSLVKYAVILIAASA